MIESKTMKVTNGETCLFYTFVRSLSPCDIAIAWDKTRALEQNGCCRAVMTANQRAKDKLCSERDQNVSQAPYVSELRVYRAEMS